MAGTSLARERPTIVFLHGLGRTHRSMHGLRRYVETGGSVLWVLREAGEG